MVHYKEYDYRQGKFILISCDEQILPGSFGYTLNQLIDNELDLSVFDGRYANDRQRRPRLYSCHTVKDHPLRPLPGQHHSRHQLATIAMVFKLVYETRKTWKKIKNYKLIPKVLERVTFVDGELPNGEEPVA